MTVPYEIFETTLGWVGLAATEKGLVRSVLPRSSRESVEKGLAVSRQTFDRLVRPPERATVLLSDYYRGETVDLSGLTLDLTEIGLFDRTVYEIVAGIRGGHVLTYGDTARRIGNPGAARAVGGAMSRNPLPPIIPCHRVVGSDGRLGGFSAEGGIALKRRLLAMEGVVFRGDRVIL